MQITIFKDIKETSQPFYRHVDIIIKRIREGASKDLVKKIRSEKNKENRNIFKQKLPAVCFSGTFNKRNDGALQEHSGLICLDFDGYPSSKDMLMEKEKLCKDKFVYSVFISPSGQGLKALVKIPKEPDNHKNYFNSLEVYFGSDYFDKTSKNISRVCYESYDPLIHSNETSSVWDKIYEEQYTEVEKHVDIPTIPITDENKIVDILTKWWQKKYPMVEGQRNHNAFVLASAFNDFGVSKTLAEYVLNGYSSKDFNRNEIKRTIHSAYQQVQNFGTKYYEDQEQVDKIKAQLKRGVTKKEIRSELEDSKIEVGVIDNVINRIEEEQSNSRFWTQSDKGVIKIEHILFKHFLEEHGFYKFNPEGSKNYVFVKVTNNLIDHTSEKEIKDFILNHLINLDEIQAYNYFAENTRYFREEFLTLLSSIDVYFIEDTKSTAYLYFNNSAVKITYNSITAIDYLDLGGYVWKDHVIDRAYISCESTDCDYKTFIENISSKDKLRISSFRSTIGYLLHGWKNLSYCPATILNDEQISDSPEGGTGKGLFMTALGKMKKLVVIDGKSFNFDKSFAYQLVSADTQILCFDDVSKQFNFEKLFSVVTEGLTLEKKNKDAIKIPFSKSPKVCITTNYAIKGKGNSFERRKWDLELGQYYNKDLTPLREFGKLMFGEWNDKEWCGFDNYMIECLQIHLEHGLIKSPFVNLKTRNFVTDTEPEFVEWCGVLKDMPPNESLELNKRSYKQDLYVDFIEDNPDFGPKAKLTISRTKFYKWLVAYNQFKYDCNPEEGKDHTGRWIRFRNKHELEINTEIEF